MIHSFWEIRLTNKNITTWIISRSPQKSLSISSKHFDGCLVLGNGRKPRVGGVAWKICRFYKFTALLRARRKFSSLSDNLSLADALVNMIKRFAFAPGDLLGRIRRHVSEIRCCKPKSPASSARTAEIPVFIPARSSPTIVEATSPPASWKGIIEFDFEFKTRLFGTWIVSTAFVRNRDVKLFVLHDLKGNCILKLPIENLS